MKRFEAETLEKACQKAANEFNCLVTELVYDIVQYPKKGFLGLFSKNAIIVATLKNIPNVNETQKDKSIKNSNKEESQEVENPIHEKVAVVDNFFNETKDKERIPAITAPELEEKIKKLLSHSCFDIDTVEVDIEDNTAYVFIDGEDAALLIGKEGYRYNALSYILFNWINVQYGLYLKLEIAQFLASQQEMIKNQLQPVVEHVEREGWGRTRELNGILVQIALEYLRGRFPNKYVAIKRSKNGERYIVINEFNKK